MKKTILIFGLISGVISSVLMFGTFRFLSNLNHGQTALVIGYANIVLGFLLVYFGIRSYRDNLAGRRHHLWPRGSPSASASLSSLASSTSSHGRSSTSTS